MLVARSLPGFICFKVILPFSPFYISYFILLFLFIILFIILYFILYFIYLILFIYFVVPSANPHTNVILLTSDLSSNFSYVQSFLLQKYPYILVLCEINLYPLSDLHVDGNYLVNLASSTHLHALLFFFARISPLYVSLILKFVFLCLRFTLLHSISYLFPFWQWLLVHADSNSIDDALQLHPSISVFDFGDFNTNHLD